MNEMTLAEWLDKWYNLYAKPFLKTSTLVSYNGYIKNHIKPFIGQLKLTDLNGIVLQEFFNEKYKSGRLDHEGGLSEKTVLNIRQMLHAALRKALENGFIPANYVEHVRLQKVSIPDMRVLTVEEQHRFVSTLVLHQDEYSIGFILLLATGIRIGEACALKWNNIDFLKKKIMIRKTLQRLPNLNPDAESKTTIVINSPKSDRSIRDIYVMVVPNHLTEQMGQDFLKLYPNANILVATKNDFTKENRQKLCAKIATGNFDAVIIGHSQITKIPVSIERQQKTIQEQIEDLRNGIEEMQDQDGAKFTVKQMEKAVKNLETKLEKLQSEKQDDVVTFEQLGIDKMFVDEAHECTTRS